MEFKIEDNIAIPQNRATAKSNEGLYSKIINTVDKLVIKQSIFIPITEFGDSKNIGTKLSYKLKQLEKVYKAKDILVAYTTSVIKDESKKVIGMRIWRIL